MQAPRRASRRAPITLTAVRGQRAIGSSAAPNPATPRKRRMSAAKKQEAVLRVLRGEDLELVSREFGTTAADLSGWRDSFLEAGAASLKSRPEDDRDKTIKALHAKVGEITMANELLEAKIDRLEAGAPFRLRRLKT